MAGLIETPGAGFNRRSFMAAMLGACVAPAIVRAQSLMPILVPDRKIVIVAKDQMEEEIRKAQRGDWVRWRGRLWVYQRPGDDPIAPSYDYPHDGETLKG